jgi:hypothetical protein
LEGLRSWSSLSNFYDPMLTTQVCDYSTIIRGVVNGRMLIGLEVTEEGMNIFSLHQSFKHLLSSQILLYWNIMQLL